MIVIRPYYPVGSERVSRSAVSLRAFGIYANATDVEPAYVTFGYPSWLFKKFVYKLTPMIIPRHKSMDTPTIEEARKLVPNAFGVLKS